MATADPSIFNALMPRKSAFDYANEFEQQGMRREQQGMARQQNALALEQAQQARADDRALRNVLSSGLDFDTKEGQAALYRANPKAAPGFLKSRQEAVKAQGEITKLTGENLDAGLSRYRKMLDSVADPQSAVQWLQAQYSDPVVGPVMSKMAPFEEAVKRIPSTPAEFAQWRQKSSMGMEAYQKHVAPAPKEIRLGDRVVVVDLNPNSPTFRQQIMEQAVGVGPDARLSADTARRGQDLFASTAMRGHNMPDAHEAAAGGGGVRLTESQSKASTYLGQMRAASKAIEELSPDQSNPVEQARVASAGNVFGNWIAGPQGQQVRQAQEQWAEAFLRHKTGAAATEPEVKRNLKTFFPQMGDGPDVIKQKARMRQQAESDIEISAGPGAQKVQVVGGSGSGPKDGAPQPSPRGGSSPVKKPSVSNW